MRSLDALSDSRPMRPYAADYTLVAMPSEDAQVNML